MLVRTLVILSMVGGLAVVGCSKDDPSSAATPAASAAPAASGAAPAPGAKPDEERARHERGGEGGEEHAGGREGEHHEGHPPAH